MPYSSLISRTLRIPAIPAQSWNALRAQHQRNRPLRGTGVTLRWTADGVLVSLEVGENFTHPWTIQAGWVWDKTIKPLGGQWMASVTPGFVDGKDVTISVVQKGQTVASALTDLPVPQTALSFRDPTLSAGPSTDADGNLITLPGEGYPAFFATIGVKPADPGSVTTMNQVDDPGRNRQIVACDIVLVMPRITTQQDATILDAQTDSQSIQISTTIEAPLIGPSRAWLDAVPKWTPPVEPDPADLLTAAAAQPRTDELLIATLFLVSPANFDGDAPDASWTPYPQNFVFWNLFHASADIPPTAPPDPITFPLGGVLADGITAGLINSLLSAQNDESDQIAAYLDSGNFAGKYWS